MQNCKNGRLFIVRPEIAKTFRIMRVTVFLMLATCLQVSAAVFSQDVKVSLNEKQIRLDKLFKVLEKKTKCYFSYSSDFVPLSKKVDVRADDERLSSVLERVLKAVDLGYYFVDEKLIVITSSLLPADAPLNADTSIVRGRITDVNDLPLEGVTISAGEQEATGTQSGKNGEFSLAVATNADIIVSHLGYRTQTLSTKGKTYFSIILQIAASQLQDVVVNGIYARPVENYTGAANSFTELQIRQVSNRNVFNAIKSLDPSFRIPDNFNLGSDPNHLPELQMRGANSLPNTEGVSEDKQNLRGDYIDNPNLPLFILDGFEVSLQRIYDLDLNRVENLTLLKDAAATAIYGSRAANGVVVIDTKQPAKGKLQVTYNSNYTLTTPDLTSYDLLNAEEKLELELASGVYHLENPVFEQGYLEMYNRRLAEARRGVNTYWLSKPLRNSFGTKQSLFVSGGDNYIRYGVDFSYNNDNNGVMKGSGRTNYSGGVNLSYRRGSLLVQNYFSAIANRAIRSPYGSFSSYAALNPYLRDRDSAGNIPKVLEYVINEFNSKLNPLYNPLYNATLHTKDFTRYVNLTNNTQVQWELSSAVKLTGRFSFYNQKDHYEKFLPADATEFINYTGGDYFRRGSYTISDGDEFNYQGDFTVNYGKSFGSNTLYITAGTQFQENRYTSNGITAEGFPNQDLDNIGYGFGIKENSLIGDETIRRNIGFLANASYSYNNRFLLDASFRTDGSSQFGTNKLFAPFYSIGAGWNLHKERFMQELDYISRLKLRASFGSTGSQSFPSYMSLQSYRYLTGEQYRNATGALLIGLGNPDLQWQQSYKTNIGADVELIRSRILFTANVYRERTDALITSVSTPPSMGFLNYKANLGEVENKGIELYLTAFLIKKDRENINWSVNAAFFHNRNRILKISDALKQQNEEQISKSGSLTTPVLLLEEGQSQTAIYAVPSRGIDPSNGYELYVKKDGSLTYVWDPRDQVAIGDREAKFYGTFGTNFMYKGFSVNLNFRATSGGYLYNQTLSAKVEDADLTRNVDRRIFEQRWRKPGDHVLYKGVVDLNGKTRTDKTKATSRFVQKNNTLYCDAVNVGYQFPSSFLKRYDLQRLQLFFYMNSPFVISSIKQERGLDYPFAHTYSFSVQFSF